MNELPPCPYCGISDAVYIKGRISGPITFYFYEDGAFDSTSIDDEARRTPGKTIYCLSCNKPRRDLVLTEYMQVVPKSDLKKTSNDG